MPAVPIGMLPRLPGLPGRGESGPTSGFRVKAAPFTLADGDRVLADMTAGAWSMKLPVMAAPGDSFELLTYGTNLLTIDRNGHKIAGIADDGAIPGGSNARLRFIYLNSTHGFVYGGAL